MAQFLLHHFARRHDRITRSLRHAARDVDGVTIAAVLLQWVAAVFLALSFAHGDTLEHTETRTLLLVAACGSGPLTCMGLLRATHRLRRQRKKQEHLMHRTRHDDLTGLPNRGAMRAHLQEAVLAESESPVPFTCMYLDLDGVRFANALFGYQAGDELLTEIVRRVNGCLAPTDHFSRFGGDKFVLLVHRALLRGEMEALAEAIIDSVARPLTLKGQQFHTGVSIGIANFPEHATTEGTLLAAAERAMYTVKRAGRSAFCYAEQQERPGDTRRCMLESKLQAALHTGGLRLEYQPIFSMEGDIVAAEALCRWHDETEGNISPAEFIPIAEATGLIVPLTGWVLRQACKQMQSWLAMGSSLQRVAVNICMLQASRSDFVSTIEQTLHQTGLPARCLELEVTESALAHDFDSVCERVRRLRKLGIRIAIDDFGTGYSSFGRLRDLEVDALKIDRVFVQGAGDAPNGIAVLQSIVEMAHKLQLSVVAEGVETSEQLHLLQDIGCDDVQGFLLGRPQTADVLSRLLEHGMQKSAETSSMFCWATSYA